MSHITILIPLTRHWRIAPLCKDILASIKDAQHTNTTFDLLWLCDNNQISNTSITNELDHHKELPESTIIHTKQKPLPRWNRQLRRQRIADNYNLAGKHIPQESDYVLIIEDDTQIPLWTITDLLKIREHAKGFHDGNELPIGIISGVQVGRHGIKHIGAWITDNPAEPTSWQTIPYRTKQHNNVEIVHATGLYCCLIPRTLFCDTPLRVTNVGADMNLGIDIWNKGYLNLITWSIQCGHVDQNTVLFPDEECCIYREELINNVWTQTQPKGNP